MHINVSHYNSLDEMQVVAKFIKWQKPGDHRFEHLDKIAVLKENKGRPGVKIEINGVTIWGFKNLLELWEDNGLWLI